MFWKLRKMVKGKYRDKMHNLYSIRKKEERKGSK